MPQTLEEILSLDRNQIAFDHLVRALTGSEHARPIALVGAGLSARLGYPSWKALLDGIHDELERAPGRSPSKAMRDYDDLLWRAQHYRSLMGDEAFLARISATFGGPRECDGCIHDLVRLPFRHFMTTNYDASLEDAHRAVRPREEVRTLVWGNPEHVLEFMCGVSNHEYPRRYVHLHGRHDNPASIVLSDADYTKRYVQSDETTKKLFALFAMQRFVFVGFSLSDPDLMEILREVNAHLGGREPRHIALIGLKGTHDVAMHRERFAMKFGVLPIFFDVSEDFEGLPVLVRGLVERCLGAEVPHPASAVPAAAEPVPPPQPAPRAIDVAQRAPMAFDSEVLREESADPFERAFADELTEAAEVEREMSPGAAAALDELPFERPAEIGERPAVETPFDPDDPHKGRFGDQPARDGKVLRGWVESCADSAFWYDVTMEVAAEPGAPPLTGPVTFFLHPTFSPPEVTTTPMGGVARLEIRSYGAFTVGAETADGTRLELCLAHLPDAPMEFRMR